MTLQEFQGLTGGIAVECRRMAGAIGHLEGGLIAYARGEIASDGLIKELQTIDATQQSLEDIARILEILSTSAGSGVDCAGRALDAARQTSIRSRVLGSSDAIEEADRKQTLGSPPRSDDDIELW